MRRPSKSDSPKCLKYQNVPYICNFWHIGKPWKRFQCWVRMIYFLTVPDDHTVTLLFEECTRKYSQGKIFPEALPGEHIILLRRILLSMLHANSTKEIEISLGFASWNFELFCGVCVKFPQGVYTKILSFHWNDFRGFFVDCYELHLRAIFQQELTKFLFNHNPHLFGNSCFPQYLNTIVFLLNGQVFFRQFRQFYLKTSQRHNIHGKLGNNNPTEITGLAPIKSSPLNKLYVHLLQMPIRDDPVFIFF